MKREKYNDQNLFNEEKKKYELSKEENQQEDGHTAIEGESEQIKNANAAGMGALERSDKNQIKIENQNGNEDKDVY